MKNTFPKEYLFIAMAGILFLMACGARHSKEKTAEAKDSLSVPRDIRQVVGIGKVEPLDGIVDLASDVGGIVTVVKKQSGDSVKKGETILVLNQSEASLKVQQKKDEIATQQQIEADLTAVERYRVQVRNKAKTLSVSKELLKTGAETQENVNNLQTDLEVLQSQLSQSQKSVSVSRSKIRELQSQLKSAENSLSEKTIEAPSDGVILNMDAKAGGAVQALQSFASFAPDGPWIVRGEADEMFANRLNLGQQVTIHYIGNNHTITTGKISSLSPDLSNKSLFTDEPGEQQDRRVRRFKVMLDSNDHLLLNSKVECNIQIENNHP